MTDELLAYLLDDLSPRRREEVELKIQSDPQWRREFERLRDCFVASQQDADADGVESAPADLVVRTCELVDSGEFASLAAISGAASSSAEAKLSEVDVRSRRAPGSWSLSDVSIAAGVVLVLVGLVSPALLRGRDVSREFMCQEYLRKLATRTSAVAEMRAGLLPVGNADEPNGVYPWLISSVLGIPFEEVLPTFFCPNSRLIDDIADGKVTVVIKQWRNDRNADGETPQVVVYYLGELYAYQPGFVDKLGSIRPRRYTFATRRPLAGHPPTLTADGQVLLPDGGCRQNMVFEDCHVEDYRRMNALNDDNPFLNDNGEHAASYREGDSILLRGDLTPWGLSLGESKPSSGP